MNKHSQSWSPADGIKLEPNADAAVRSTKGSTVVTAGPGAGKTELLAQRAVYSLSTGQCPYPRRILAISFKDSAAKNLRSRVRARTAPELSVRLDSFTFHAFAKRILDNNLPLVQSCRPLDPGYTMVAGETVSSDELSFDELIPLATEIVQTNDYVRNGIRHTYSHVFFDEFQDATAQQYDFLVECFGDSDALLTAVGDPKQRIMRFAGALPGVLSRFASDFDALHLVLYQNFRSAPRLRRMQNRIIRDLDPDAAVPDDSITGDAGEIDLLTFDTSQEEAVYVAELIRGELDKGMKPSEIALLFRSNVVDYSEQLVSELTRRGVPIAVDRSDEGVFKEPLGALLLDFVRVIAGTREPLAYGSLMQSIPSTEYSEEAELRIHHTVIKTIQDLRGAYSPDGSVPAHNFDWRTAILRFMDAIGRPGIASLSREFTDSSSLERAISGVTESLLEKIEASPSPIDAALSLSGEDSVRLMTIHKSKGLEFRHVIIVGVEREAFWSSPNNPESDNISLFFVAASRAKDRLTLTFSKSRPRPSSRSSFWRENRRPKIEYFEFAHGA